MGMTYVKEQLFFSMTSSNTSTRLLAAEPPLNTTTFRFWTPFMITGIDIVHTEDSFEKTKDGQPPFGMGYLTLSDLSSPTSPAASYWLDELRLHLSNDGGYPCRALEIDVPNGPRLLVAA